MTELKPCPFCGGKAYIWDDVGFYIECEDCCCRTIEFSFKKDAVKAWNRRVNDDTKRSN